MNIFDVRNAVQQAEDTLRAADNCAEKLAELLTERRLRLLSSYELRRLKRELSKFDSVKRRWKA